MITKNFSTQTVETSSCWFRRDYSYRTNPNTCLECEFCYKHATCDPERRRSASYIDTSEKYHSKTIFKTPVVISRFCDPFIDGACTDASMLVAQKCIDNNCQFIFKTGLTIPSKAQELMKKSKDKCQLQLRFISDWSISGLVIAKELSPGMLPVSTLLPLGKAAIYQHIDTVAIFDPFIIGVNNIQCKMLIKDLANYGFKKLIVKQLFASERFLQYLKIRVDRKYTQMLDIPTAGYWTYPNITFLSFLYPVIEECNKYGISLSICSNRAMNEIIYGDKNCCQFENPIGFYDKDGKIINEEVLPN